MADRAPLYRFESDAGSGAEPLQRAGLLIVALGGFIDAGQVQQSITEHLIAELDSQVVASFRLDELYDYRARRPVMVFDKDRWTSYADPALLLHSVKDADGQRFWLLAGPEPDYQWERFVDDLMRLMLALGVDLVVSVHGIPMGVPHTRPVGLTAHGTNPALLPPSTMSFDDVQVPGSVTGLLEYRLGERARNAVGFAVHVPHYISARPFLTGALAALDAVEGISGLDLARDALVERAAHELREIDAEIRDREGIPEALAAMEAQYDAFVAGRERASLLAQEQDLPSADEIGAQAEEFLRRATDPHEPN